MPAVARFFAAFAATLVAAATIGKLVPHIPRLAAEFDISLGAAGFLVSSVMLPGALAGPLFGALADRVAPKWVALWGLALGALASALLPFATSASLFFLIRVLEGVGFTLLAVAATLVVVEVSSSQHRSLALATFSSFAPLGFALGQFLAAGASARAIGFAHAAALLLMLTLFAAAVPATRSGSSQRARLGHGLRHPPALRTAMAFGCVAGLLLGAVAVAPLILAARFQLTVEEAARLTALAALPGIAGRFLSGWLLGQWAPLRVYALGAALGVLSIPLAMLAPLPLGVALAAFALFQICMGALAGILSAMLPRVAPSPAQLGTVTGLANQLITAGNLAGPPLVLAVLAAAGATAATALLIAAAALSVWLIGGVALYRRALAS